MKLKVGDKVGAISHRDDKNVYFFGFGTYQGEELPPPEIKFMGQPMKNKNPKIVLDNGKIVWGCECWWGPKELVERHLKIGTIVMVDIDKARKEAEERVREYEEDE